MSFWKLVTGVAVGVAVGTVTGVMCSIALLEYLMLV